MNAASVKDKVYTTINKHGKSVSVLKYLGYKTQAPNDPYGPTPRDALFATEVLAKSHTIINPTFEVVSQYGGNEKQYDAIFVFAVKELELKFGEKLNKDWITTSDRISFRNNTYSISKVAVQGEAFQDDSPTVVVCFGATIKGVSPTGP